jgi:hypothetical protein
MLLDAVAAALGASKHMAESLDGKRQERLQDPPPPQVLDQLRQGLTATAGTRDQASADNTLRLAEAIRVLAVKHGPAALAHCLRLVDSVATLLDQVTAEAGAIPHAQ